MEGLDLVSVGVDSDLEFVLSDDTVGVVQEQLQANSLVDVSILDNLHCRQVVDVDQRNHNSSLFVSAIVHLV